MKKETKTKVFILPCVALCSLGLMFSSTEAFSFSFDLESQDIEQGLDYVKDSQVTESAKWIFSQAWSEVHDFIINGLDDIASSWENSSQEEQIALLPMPAPVLNYAWVEKDRNTTYKKGVSLGKKYFSDVASDVNRDAIYLLADNNIVYSGAENFYPYNAVRLHECVKMLLESCRVVLGEEWLVSDKESLLVKSPRHYQLADSLWMLEGIVNPEDFERFITAREYEVLLQNFSLLYTPLSRQEAVNNEYWKTITRSEMAKKIVELFNYYGTKDTRSEVISSDSVTSAYDPNVDILIRHTMYPFSSIKTWEVSRIGFAKFLAQVHASYYGNSLVARWGKQLYSDVDYLSDSYMYYLQKHHILDYLTEVKRWKSYLYPERAITQYEIYYIVSKVFGKNYSIAPDADEKKMTYSDLSRLFVDVIARSEKVESQEEIHASVSTWEKSSLLKEVLALFVK